MSWQVINRIAECDDGQTIRKNLTRVTCLVIHRISTSLGTNAEEIAKSFQDTSNQWSAGSYTGGQVPYSFLCKRDGMVEQMLKLNDTGWHARRWSRAGVGIACLGDFRSEYPSLEMWESLVTLCSTLCHWIGVCEIYSHSELPFASKDPEKQCPGKNLDMDRLRGSVTQKVKNSATDLTRLGKDLILENYGIVLR